MTTHDTRADILNALPCTLGPAPNSAEWEALRNFDPERPAHPVHFGASEAAAACGLLGYASKTGSIRGLYEKKRGTVCDDHSEELLQHFEVAHAMEPIILSFYAKECGNDQVLTEIPMLFSTDPALWYMSATPDALRCRNGVLIRSVDSKASDHLMQDASGEDDAKYGAAGTDAVPLSILLQAQQQMAITGTSYCDVPVWFAFRSRPVYHVPRDEQLIKLITEREKELAERIINADPPEWDYEHAGTAQLLHDVYGFRKDIAETSLTDDDEALWWQYRSLKSQIKELETNCRGISNRLLSRLEGATIGNLPGGQTLKRSEIAESYITEDDVMKLALRVGTPKRRAYVKLSGPTKRKKV